MDNPILCSTDKIPMIPFAGGFGYTFFECQLCGERKKKTYDKDDLDKAPEITIHKKGEVREHIESDKGYPYLKACDKCGYFVCYKENSKGHKRPYCPSCGNFCFNSKLFDKIDPRIKSTREYSMSHIKPKPLRDNDVIGATVGCESAFGEVKGGEPIED